MAKTNKVARHHELNKIAAILQEMGTQYVEQFLPGRGRAEQWQRLSPRAGLHTPPRIIRILLYGELWKINILMFTSTNEKPVLVDAPINFLGF
jgi:hypothetical protein